MCRKYNIAFEYNAIELPFKHCNISFSKRVDVRLRTYGPYINTVISEYHDLKEKYKEFNL